jgi:hypothetical protein
MHRICSIDVHNLKNLTLSHLHKSHSQKVRTGIKYRRWSQDGRFVAPSARRLEVTLQRILEVVALDNVLQGQSFVQLWPADRNSLLLIRNTSINAHKFKYLHVRDSLLPCFHCY